MYLYIMIYTWKTIKTIPLSNTLAFSVAKSIAIEPPLRGGSVNRVVRLRTTSNVQPFYAMRAMSCACGADARCAFSVRLPSNLRPLHPALRLSMRSPVVSPVLFSVRVTRCSGPRDLRPRMWAGSTPNYAAYRRQGLAE